jgi:hypothetical protein
MGLVEGFDPFKIIKTALKKGGEFCDLYLEETLAQDLLCLYERHNREGAP